MFDRVFDLWFPVGAGMRTVTEDLPRTPDGELDVEAAAVVAYGNILPQDVLDIPRHGWVNLHFSLLPAWRGASPVNAAIAAGDEITINVSYGPEQREIQPAHRQAV